MAPGGGDDTVDGRSVSPQKGHFCGVRKNCARVERRGPGSGVAADVGRRRELEDKLRQHSVPPWKLRQGGKTWRRLQGKYRRLFVPSLHRAIELWYNASAPPAEQAQFRQLVKGIFACKAHADTQELLGTLRPESRLALTDTGHIPVAQAGAGAAGDFLSRRFRRMPGREGTFLALREQVGEDAARQLRACRLLLKLYVAPIVAAEYHSVCLRWLLESGESGQTCLRDVLGGIAGVARIGATHYADQFAAKADGASMCGPGIPAHQELCGVVADFMQKHRGPRQRNLQPSCVPSAAPNLSRQRPLSAPAVREPTGSWVAGGPRPDAAARSAPWRVSASDALLGWNTTSREHFPPHHLQQAQGVTDLVTCPEVAGEWVYTRPCDSPAEPRVTASVGNCLPRDLRNCPDPGAIREANSRMMIGLEASRSPVWGTRAPPDGWSDKTRLTLGASLPARPRTASVSRTLLPPRPPRVPSS